MRLFRPYERNDPSAPDTSDDAAPERGSRRQQSMVIKSTGTVAEKKAGASATSGKTAGSTVAKGTVAEGPAAEGPAGETTAPASARSAGPRTKQGPTPTRRQAEAARRERVNPVLSPKERRRREAAATRTQRLKTMAERDAAPEKQLLRDYIDARFSLGEILLPGVVVLLALSFLNAVVPGATLITTGLMYLFILAVIVDGVLMWRGFRKVLADRYPRASRTGLLFYGLNRMIQIRRFRMPKPRLKRGDEY